MPLQRLMYDFSFFFQNNEMMVIRIGIFFLILIMILLSLGRIKPFKENRGVVVIISTIISLIAAFYLKEEIIQQYILGTYQTLGIILLMLIPALIILFLIHKSGLSSSLRRGIWIIFGVILLFFLLATNTTETLKIYSYSAGILMTIILILFDKSINKTINS